MPRHTGPSLGGAIRRPIVALLERASPPDDPSTHEFLLAATILVVALVGLVPLVAIPLGVSWLLALVPAVAIGYAGFVYATDRVFEGTVSAFFVLSVFNANVPLLTGPGVASLSLLIVDPVIVVLLVVLVRDFLNERSSGLGLDRTGTASVVAAAIFVLWTALSAAAGNGPSPLAAWIFAVEQIRYLAVFVVSILVVRRTSLLCGLYPLSVAVVGNLAFAVAEVANGRSFGLTYLGEKPGKMLFSLPLGPITIPTGYYPGGFVGHARELVGLLLLIVPFLVFWAAYESWVRTALGATTVAATMLVIRVAETDAGWVASLLMLALIASVGLWSSPTDGDRNGLRSVFTALLGGLASIPLYSSRFVTLLGDGEASKGGSHEGAGGASAPGGTSGATTGGPSNGSEGEQWLVDLVAGLPLVETSTLVPRIAQYGAAIEIASQYPLFGIGGYNFFLVATSYGIHKPMGIHNTFFSHLAAVGIVGTGAFVASAVGVALIALREAFRASGRDRFLWGSLCVGLLGFHAYSFWVVMYSWVTPNAGFWAFSGIVVGGTVANVALSRDAGDESPAPDDSG